MICKLEMPDPMPYSTNCNVSGCWGESNDTRKRAQPITNQYVTENVSSHELQQDIKTSFESQSHQSINGLNQEFNPMSGIGDISSFDS